MKKDPVSKSKKRYASPRLQAQVIEFGVFGRYGCDNGGREGGEDIAPGAERSRWWST